MSHNDTTDFGATQAKWKAELDAELSIKERQQDPEVAERYARSPDPIDYSPGVQERRWANTRGQYAALKKAKAKRRKANRIAGKQRKR